MHLASSRVALARLLAQCVDRASYHTEALRNSPMKQLDYKLFADFFQFYLQDESCPNDDPGGLWTREALDRLLAVGSGIVMVGTVRNMTVPVTIEIRETEPDDDLNKWDQVNECLLDVPSGRIVVAGCTDYFPDAARITVSPGSYRVRLYYGNLDALSEDGLEGRDVYRVAIWPDDAHVAVRVIKQRKIEGKSH